MAGALATDLYELRMAVSHLRHDRHEPATFSLTVRDLPADVGFMVTAGANDVVEFLTGFSFDDGELAWAEELLGLTADDLGRLSDLRFTGDVWAVPEGRVLYPHEPLLEVTAPLPVAQIVETRLLNLVTFPTAVLTRAARCRLAAPGLDLVDFAFRRSPSFDGAMTVARATAVAGFVATSNLEAARRHGLRVAGTMAHSYVQSFRSEADAFRTYIEDFPGEAVLLVDTYDLDGGLEAAVEVLGEAGGRGAIRIDSGDLGALARRARQRLDAAGLTDVRVFVSGGLDEVGLAALARSGAPVDAAGVGTRLVDGPALDTVYKLVELDGRHVVKLSPGKVTLPGAKQVYRSAEGDVLALRDEEGPDGAEALLVPVMVEGRRVAPEEGWHVARDRLARELGALPPGVELSRRLKALSPRR